MSEYQYIEFRAIDQPVSKENLRYMRLQSSRADITPWSFENEYHYGDFHGNATEMLRRGYDIHLHYANFGIRTLVIRLPRGLPDPEAFQPYMIEDSLEFKEDKQGPGGCLFIQPYHEPGDLEEIWKPHALLTQLAPLRNEIINGDLRPLYLAHLAVACDCNHDPVETLEAPVPAGLGNLSHAQRALAQFYELDHALIASAALESLPLPSGAGDATNQYADWVRRQPAASKDAWLATLMTDPAAPVRAEILAHYRSDTALPTWPTSQPGRTIAQLHADAKVIAEKSRQRAAAKAARQREEQLAQMAATPAATLYKTEQLVARGTTKAYQQAAELLADLREALAQSNQPGLAEEYARKLKADNPTLRLLTRELRNRGFIPK